MTLRVGLGKYPAPAPGPRSRRPSEGPAVTRLPIGLAPGLSDRELGWLTGVVETDSAIYTVRPRAGAAPGKAPTVFFSIENTDRAMMTRVAGMIGARRVDEVPPRTNSAGTWTKATYRVRVQGARAVSLYRALLPYFMPSTVERVRVVFDRAGVAS